MHVGILMCTEKRHIPNTRSCPNFTESSQTVPAANRINKTNTVCQETKGESTIQIIIFRKIKH